MNSTILFRFLPGRCPPVPFCHPISLPISRCQLLNNSNAITSSQRLSIQFQFPAKKSKYVRISWRGNPPGKAEPILGTQDDKVGIFLLPSFPLVQNTHSELANISQRHTAESDIRYQIFFRDFPRRLTLCCRPAWGARRFGPDRGIWCAARPYWAGRQRSDIKGYGLNASYGMAFDQDTNTQRKNLETKRFG